MRRLLAPICIAIFTGLVIAPQAKACINDRDTFRTEQEYKKNYEFKTPFNADPKPSLESPATEGQSNTLANAATGSGVLFLVVAGSLTLVNFSRRGQK